MLPSLSKLHKLAQDQNTGRLFIELGQNSITAKLLAPRTERILWDKVWGVDGYQDTKPYLQVARELDQLLGSTAPEISIVLPDPLVRHIRFEVESLPDKTRDIEALIQWRLKEEFFLETDQHQLDYTIDTGDKQSVTVFAIDNEWLQQINETFLAHNLLIAFYNIRTLHAMEAVHDVGKPGFIINIDETFVSYSHFGDKQLPLILESQTFAADDRDGRYQFLQRARREFSATLLHADTPAEKQILKLGNQNADEALGEIFPDYSVQRIR